MFPNLMIPSLGRLPARRHPTKTPSASGKNLGVIFAANGEADYRMLNAEATDDAAAVSNVRETLRVASKIHM